MKKFLSGIILSTLMLCGCFPPFRDGVKSTIPGYEDYSVEITRHPPPPPPPRFKTFNGSFLESDGKTVRYKEWIECKKKGVASKTKIYRWYYSITDEH